MLIIIKIVYNYKKQQDNFYTDSPTFFDVNDQDSYIRCKDRVSGTLQEKVEECCSQALKSSETKYKRAEITTDGGCILYETPGNLDDCEVVDEVVPATSGAR